MNIFERTFLFSTKQSVPIAIDSMEKLLKKAALTCGKNASEVWSEHIPMPIINVDTRLYSRKNIIGINPFVYLSSFRASFVNDSDNECTVTVNVNYERSVFLFVLYAAVATFVLIALPLYTAIAWYLLIVVLIYMFFFRLTVGYLIKYEITAAIKSPIAA
jgi:hypothetical protein